LIKKEIAFIGRENEHSQLNNLLKKKTSSLVVIKGRRRIGKSRLIEEFAKKQRFYHFAGLAPTDGVSADTQRQEFALQLSQQTELPAITTTDWSTLFSLLASQCKTGKVIILLDEITWMANGDPSFLSKLKNAWDLHLKKNPNLILVLCGSISAWIEKNIISSSAFFGRISLQLTLQPLPIADCYQLLDALGFRRSTQEKLMFLSITGGIPWYIEQVIGNLSAIENIKNLCFRPSGLFVNEYQHIFHDLFGKHSQVHQDIACLLATRDYDYSEISKQLNYAKSSALSDYLNELIASGYVTQYSRWSLKTAKTLPKIKKYRLTDNFLRFYFRYLQNKSTMIQNDAYINVSPASLPGWNTMLGLQFENLILANRALLHQRLTINPEEILMSGPYFQRKTSKQHGCQIDYLIQTKYKTLFVCEIKFSQKTIGMDAVKAVQQKIDRLVVPKGFAVLPVLIHASDVSEDVLDADYFADIINVTTLNDK
jgi:uncharacterized protein